MNLQLGYGKQKIDFSVSENRLLGVLTPNNVDCPLKNVDEVERSLNAPIGTKKLEEIVNAKDKVVIITSDITRPMPSKTVLPSVLNRLSLGGVREENVTIVFALGSHRKHTEEEKKYLVGEEIYSKYTLLDSDETDVKLLGYTSSGTPVEIFTPVADADKVICLGNIEYHYFAGYSGGAKAIMPGVSTRKAIQTNHSKMVHKDARSGNVNSPVRQDVEECLDFLKVDFIVNVVLNEKKEVIKAFSGDVITAHRRGCDFLDLFYKIKIKEQADIVVVTSGGYPKDLNMYQAQKALDNAIHAVKQDGVIIWLAECKEGFGSAIFEKWMTEFTPDERLNNIQKNFVLGGHKAVAVATATKKAKVFFVSDMDKNLVEKSHLTYYNSLALAFFDATTICGENSSVIVMPYGGSTLPVL